MEIEHRKECFGNKYFTAPFVFLLGILILSIFVLALVPPVSKDALTQHLAVPKLYLKHGGIYEIPWMVFSYFPMNLDLLYMIALYFGNDIIPKIIHFSFALASAWLIFDYLKRRMNLTYALGGALFFLSIPIIVKLSITVYVDLGVIFFSTASLLLMLKWFENGFQMKFLIFSGICAGLGMGTKYNGLIIFFLLSLFVPWIHSRQKTTPLPGLGQSKGRISEKEGHAQQDKYVSFSCFRQKMRLNGRSFISCAGWAVVFVLVGLLVFSPWMIRNYVWTHNPIYPLYDAWFNPEKSVNGGHLGIFGIRSIIYGESLWEIVLLPLRVFFQGQDGNPQYFDGKLNLFLLILPIFAFLPIGRDRHGVKTEKRILVAFSLLYFAFALFSAILRIRYISPIIPPLVILSVYGVKNLFELVTRLQHPWKQQIAVVLLLGVMCVPLLLNAGYVYGQFKIVKPFDVLKGILTRDEYITRYRPEYPVMQYINANLPPDSKILFIFIGKRGYYCDRDYIFDMNSYRISLLKRLIENSDTTEEILLGLREKNITHLLIQTDIFRRWVTESFQKHDKAMVRALFRESAKRLYARKMYAIFVLRENSKTVTSER